MKRLLIVAVMLMLSTECWGFPNEPNGFRGAKWGEDLWKLKGFIITVINRGPTGDMQHYKRTEDSLTLGTTKLTAVEYWTYKHRFCSVTAKFDGLDNFSRALETLRIMYGEPDLCQSIILRKGPGCVWEGDTDTIMVSLEYDSETDEGSIHLGNMPLIRRSLADENRSLKEKIKKDF